jgi:hypothetical protein
MPETFTEWGAKWSDGGYCPAVPPRNEKFVRDHARDLGTRPIRREVGPWVFADTGEVVWPTVDAESTVAGSGSAGGAA